MIKDSVTVLHLYRTISAVPHLRDFLLWSMIGRIYYPCVPIAVTFLIADWTNSYAAAGIVGGAIAVGGGITGPIRGRLADRLGARKPLIISAGLYGCGFTSLIAITAFSSGFWPMAAALAFLTGLFSPAVGQLVRGNLGRLTPQPLHSTIFNVEMSLMESLFVLCPAMIAVVIGVSSPQLAAALCVGLALVGAVGFAGALSRAQVDKPITITQHGLPVHRANLLTNRPILYALLSSAWTSGFVIAFERVIIAIGRDSGQPLFAGGFTALWSLGSMIGGFFVASRAKNVSAAVRVAWLAVTYLIGAVALLPAIEIATWGFGVLLLILGIALAPALSANTLLINKLVPEGRKAEAFGWSLMFIMLTTAIAQPIIGWILDVSSNSAAAAICAAGTSLGVLFASLAMREPAGIADPELSKA